LHIPREGPQAHGVCNIHYGSVRDHPLDVNGRSERVLRQVFGINERNAGGGLNQIVRHLPEPRVTARHDPDFPSGPSPLSKNS